MRNQKTDAIRYRYNIVAEDGRTVIRAVPVRACRVEARSEPIGPSQEATDREHVHDAGSPPVFRRLRERLLDR